MNSAPCLRCGEPFERPGTRGRPASYCDECKPLRAAEVKAAQYVAARDQFRELREVAERLRPQVTPTEWLSVVAYMAALDLPEGTPLPLVPDRRPVGYSTAAGPDEGRTTTRGDLAAELQRRQAAALSDPWWAENAGWMAGVN